ncbi:MAG: radical SAM protein [Acidobacteriota bacterium]|nr:radical SAM protein [Acidobacteriota bacterium]
MTLENPAADALYRPYVVSWNLTYRCNLACEHCYLDAGGKPSGLPVVTDSAFSDRSELDTEGCFRVVDEIASLAPEALTILTGGEPLLRRDILEIIRYAHSRELWVVVGTNGVLVTESLAGTLAEAGVRGMALSLDSLDPEIHDGFRRVRGAFSNTVEGAKVLTKNDLSFIIQTTVGTHNQDQLEAIADFAHEELGAKVWNLYFLVPSGRGAFVSDLTTDQYDEVLVSVLGLQKKYRDRMLVNAKCAPHYLRSVLADDPSSPFVKSFSGGAGGCPAGTQYLGIRPNGDVTPCPYLPLFGGNLEVDNLRKVWNDSAVFRTIRQRDELGGRCGDCELSSHCGGCRARAYGMTGELLAADPLCSHEPGSLAEAADAAFGADRAIQYGQPVVKQIAWEPGAEERIKSVPAFVRGMVVKSVEKWCRERGIETVTEAQLEDIRSRMPTPKVFGKGS